MYVIEGQNKNVKAENGQTACSTFYVGLRLYTTYNSYNHTTIR